MIRKDDLLVRIIDLENQVEILNEDNNTILKKLKKIEKSLKELTSEK